MREILRRYAPFYIHIVMPVYSTQAAIMFIDGWLQQHKSQI